MANRAVNDDGLILGGQLVQVLGQGPDRDVDGAFDEAVGGEFARLAHVDDEWLGRLELVAQGRGGDAGEAIGQAFDILVNKDGQVKRGLGRCRHGSRRGRYGGRRRGGRGRAASQRQRHQAHRDESGVSLRIHFSFSSSANLGWPG